MTDTETPTTGIGPLFAAGLLLLAAGFSLCTQCWLHTDPTDEADWEEAAGHAVELAEPTDAIRINPPWSETPMPHLTEVGNLLHPHHRPLLEDLLGVQRLLILTESGREDEALDRLPFDADPDDIHDFGTVELLEVQVPAERRIDTDLTRQLDEATVYWKHGDKRHDVCTLRGDTWRCSRDGDSTEVRSELLEVEDEPRRCIRSDPPPGGHTLVVETTIEDPGDVLRIRAGLDRRAARLEAGDDVVYRIYLDDQQLTEHRAHAHTSQWTAHDAEPGGEPVQLRVEIESVVPDPHHRRFCFNAWGLTEQQAQ